MTDAELEALITEAGLGKRAAARLRAAKKRTASTRSAPRSSGFGAAEPDKDLVSL